MPAWRPAFSRPGFLTFKVAEGPPVDDKALAERNWTFAHSCGISLGKVVGAQLSEMVGQVWQLAEVLAAADSKTPIDIHVWQREAAVDVDASQIFVTPLCVEIEAGVTCGRAGALDIEREVPTLRRAAPRNSRVLDVVVVEPGEWWIGYHQAVRRSGALAGRRDPGAFAGACCVSRVHEDGRSAPVERPAGGRARMSASRSAVRQAARARRCWIAECSSRASIRRKSIRPW